MFADTQPISGVQLDPTDTPLFNLENALGKALIDPSNDPILNLEEGLEDEDLSDLRMKMDPGNEPLSQLTNLERQLDPTLMAIKRLYHPELVQKMDQKTQVKISNLDSVIDKAYAGLRKVDDAYRNYNEFKRAKHEAKLATGDDSQIKATGTNVYASILDGAGQLIHHKFSHRTLTPQQKAALKRDRELARQARLRDLAQKERARQMDEIRQYREDKRKAQEAREEATAAREQQLQDYAEQLAEDRRKAQEENDRMVEAAELEEERRMDEVIAKMEKREQEKQAAEEQARQEAELKRQAQEKDDKILEMAEKILKERQEKKAQEEADKQREIDAAVQKKLKMIDEAYYRFNKPQPPNSHYYPTAEPEYVRQSSSRPQDQHPTFRVRSSRDEPVRSQPQHHNEPRSAQDVRPVNDHHYNEPRRRSSRRSKRHQYQYPRYTKFDGYLKDYKDYQYGLYHLKHRDANVDLTKDMFLY